MLNEMEPIIAEIRDLNDDYPVGLIAIGGVAVYLHALHDGREKFAETTHDIDFYLSKENLGSLRDREELTPNPKLHKQQIVRKAIEMDIYVEHQHQLAVPYEELERYSAVINGVRVAAKEHLLVLKIDAAIDRFGSRKGDKDAKDLVNLVVSLGKPRESLIRPLLDAERVDYLRSLGKRMDPFQAMTGGNSHQSSALRKKFNENLDLIENAMALKSKPVVKQTVQRVQQKGRRR